MTSSMANGARLKGSLESDNKWDLMVARSRMVLDDGSKTGSLMTVNMSGSVEIMSNHIAYWERQERAYPRIRLELLRGPLRPLEKPLLLPLFPQRRATWQPRPES